MARKATTKKSEVPPETVGEGDSAVSITIKEAFTHQRRLIVKAEIEGDPMTFNLPQAQFTEKSALLKEIKYRYLELKSNIGASKKTQVEAFVGEATI